MNCGKRPVGIPENAVGGTVGFFRIGEVEVIDGFLAGGKDKKPQEGFFGSSLKVRQAPTSPTS